MHLPLKFLMKNKTGPARVCSRCIAGCLDVKIQSRNDEDTRERVRIWGMGPSRIKEISPPEWIDPRTVRDCYKCLKKTSTKHICRACGKCYCNTCSSKIDFPPEFQKKAKEGPSRCCDKCRFLLHDGFKLVPQLSEKPNIPTRRPTMQAERKISVSKDAIPEPKAPSRPPARVKQPVEDSEMPPPPPIPDDDDDVPPLPAVPAPAQAEARPSASLPFNQRCAVALCQFARGSSGLYCQGHAEGTIPLSGSTPDGEAEPKSRNKSTINANLMSGLNPMAGMALGLGMNSMQLGGLRAGLRKTQSNAELLEKERQEAERKAADKEKLLQSYHRQREETERQEREQAEKKKQEDENKAKIASTRAVASPAPPPIRASGAGRPPASAPSAPAPAPAPPPPAVEEGSDEDLLAPPDMEDSGGDSSLEEEDTVVVRRKISIVEPPAPKELPPAPAEVPLTLPPTPTQQAAQKSRGPPPRPTDVLRQNGFDERKKYVEVLWDDDGNGDDELRLVKGEYIEVTDDADAEGWWTGIKMTTKEEGLFPWNLVKALNLSAKRAELEAKKNQAESDRKQALEDAERKKQQQQQEEADRIRQAEEREKQQQLQRQKEEAERQRLREEEERQAAAKAREIAAVQDAQERAARLKIEQEAAEQRDRQEAARRLEAARIEQELKRKLQAAQEEEKAKRLEAEKQEAARRLEAERVENARVEAARIKREREEKEQAEKASAQPVMVEAVVKRKKKKCLCPALYDHKGAEDDELCMAKGDIINVIKKDADGWWLGRNEATGTVGLFPCNYVGPPLAN